MNSVIEWGVITTVISLIVWLYNYRRNKHIDAHIAADSEYMQSKAASENIHADVIKELREFIASLQQELKSEKNIQSNKAEKIHALHLEFERYKSKIELIRSVFIDIPIPMWIKDKNSVMIEFNKPYEEFYIIPSGKDPKEYPGKNDVQFWGEDPGRKFMENDRKSQHRTSIFREHVFIQEERRELIVVKWGIKASGKVIAYGGLSIDKKLIEK